MTWTRDQQLEALMALPWTVATAREADGSLSASIAELESVVATGKDDRELARDLWESVEAALDAYLEHGDTIPLPPDAMLPWERDRKPPVQPTNVWIRFANGEAWQALTTPGPATLQFAA